MKFDISKIANGSFDEIIARVTEELKKEGFGVITTVDLKEKFQEKLNIEFRKYTILGACNPKLAYQAIQLEDKIGTMLPCNVLVQEHGDGKVEVSAMNPLESMGSVDNEQLHQLAHDVSNLLRKVVDRI